MYASVRLVQFVSLSNSEYNNLKKKRKRKETHRTFVGTSYVLVLELNDFTSDMFIINIVSSYRHDFFFLSTYAMRIELIQFEIKYETHKKEICDK